MYFFLYTKLQERLINIRLAPIDKSYLKKLEKLLEKLTEKSSLLDWLI